MDKLGLKFKWRWQVGSEMYGLNISSCGRYRAEVIKHEARGQKGSLRERVYNEKKREKRQRR